MKNPLKIPKVDADKLARPTIKKVAKYNKKGKEPKLADGSKIRPDSENAILRAKNAASMSDNGKVDRRRTKRGIPDLKPRPRSKGSIPDQGKMKLANNKPLPNEPAFGAIEIDNLFEQRKYYTGVKMVIEGREPRQLDIVTDGKLRAIKESFSQTRTKVEFQKGKPPIWMRSKVFGGKLLEAQHAKRHGFEKKYRALVNEAYHDFQRMFAKSKVLVENDVDQKALCRKTFERVLSLSEKKYQKMMGKHEVIAHVAMPNGDKQIIKESVAAVDEVSAGAATLDKIMEDYGIRAKVEKMYVDSRSVEATPEYTPLNIKTALK